jgi:hypothetical protein
MRLAKKAAEFARARRDICLHTEPVPETAVLNTDVGAYVWNECSPHMMGAGKALIALHRSPVYMDETGLSGSLPYELIVLPENRTVPPSAVRRLERYVKQGGRLLSIGDAATVSPELQRLLGIKLRKPAALNDGHIFRRDGDPTGVFADWDEYGLVTAKKLYPLYRSWDHCNPEARRIKGNWPMHGHVDEEHPEKAGMPAATVRKLGKGMAVHVATRLMSQYWQYGNPDQLAWIREILDYMIPSPMVRTDAPGCVELSLRRKGSTLLLHLVNGNPGRDISLVNSEDWWVDDIPALGPINLWIKCGGKPGEVSWQPGGAKLESSYRDGILRVTVPRLEVHGCVAVGKAIP